MEEKIFNNLSVDLIGLAGAAGCGKDTAAQVISEQYGIPLYALATPIKKSINDIFSWDERHGWGDLKEAQVTFETFKGWKFKVVDVLRENIGPLISSLDRYETLELFLDKVLPEYVGALKDNEVVTISTSPRKMYQLFGTDFGRQLNSNCWLKLSEHELKKHGCLVITDVRFENEAEFIRSRGGRIIHIDRADVIEVNTHISEAGIKKVNKDITILNDSSLELFEGKIADISLVL